MRACCRFLRAAPIPSSPSAVLRPSTRAASTSSTPPQEQNAPASKWLEQKAKKGPSMNLDEALYVSKMAGIWTTQEVQLQIVRSPPFSKAESPFTLENFYEVADAESYEDLKGEKDQDDASQDLGGIDKDKETWSADPVIHQTIERYFRPDLPPKFVHNGAEWLSKAEGRGTRKRASAHAVIVRGTGLFRVNGEQDIYARWPHIYNRMDVCQPFKLTGTAGQYDVFVEVRGGGLGGQAGATRLAVARALLQANPSCHDDLQKGFCLLEDTRQKMSKQAGRAGARKGYPWNKR